MIVFKHAYKNETDYDIIEITSRYSRKVDPEYYLYQEWILENTPEIISGDEFVIITDGIVSIDPNKDTTLLARQWSTIRSQRDALLTSSDWTQIPDSPKCQDESWLNYRQALRDITTQSDPFNIDWPETPED